MIEFNGLMPPADDNVVYINHHGAVVMDVAVFEKLRTEDMGLKILRSNVKKEKLDERRCENCYHCDVDEIGSLCCVCLESEHCADFVEWWDVCERWAKARK